MVWGWQGRAAAALLLAALAGAPAAADLPDQAVCAAAGAAAEQAAGLPANLLLSIGMVESGRADPLTGQVAPWPWTVNVDGAGQYFNTKADAVAFTRLAESSGAGDVDVGCFQISLENHPDAFATLDQAFDPAANAAYAAGFLNQLKAQTGSWNMAIADYHSAVPDLGLPYQRRVLAAWHGLGDVPAGIDAAADGGFGEPDPVVIKLAPAARLVRVYTLDDPPGAGLARGLPRVISP
jgi:soluble lytic murein transglycosylase-like protein